MFMGAAAAVCVNDRHEILMVLQGKPEEEKTWSVPSGRLEPDETYEQCCAREVWEETGYRVRVNRLIHTKADGLIKYYEVELLGGRPKLHDPDQLSNCVDIA